MSSSVLGKKTLHSHQGSKKKSRESIRETQAIMTQGFNTQHDGVLELNVLALAQERAAAAQHWKNIWLFPIFVLIVRYNKGTP